MSLICDETKRDIEFGDPLMAATREDISFYSAISAEILSQITADEKRSEPANPGDGVNIHHASSGKNFNGSYTLTGFTLGEFALSISKETAQRVMPRHCQSYPENQN